MAVRLEKIRAGRLYWRWRLEPEMFFILRWFVSYLLKRYKGVMKDASGTQIHISGVNPMQLGAT